MICLLQSPFIISYSTLCFTPKFLKPYIHTYIYIYRYRCIPWYHLLSLTRREDRSKDETVASLRAALTVDCSWFADGRRLGALLYMENLKLFYIHTMIHTTVFAIYKNIYIIQIYTVNIDTYKLYIWHQALYGGHPWRHAWTRGNQITVYKCAMGMSCGCHHRTWGKNEGFHLFTRNRAFRQQKNDGFNQWRKGLHYQTWWLKHRLGI